MEHTYNLAHRAARFRASILALLALSFGACNSDELTNSIAEDPTNPIEAAEPVVVDEAPSFATSFAGGIAMGHFGQPLSAFGSINNGAKMTVSPGSLMEYLAGVRARGGKVVLMFAGPHRYYLDGSGHFSMTKWKARIDRFRNINFSSYITNGTIIGHLLVDEPNDASNWGGRAIPASTVDEMARYSKARWSSMPTIARVEPYYFRSQDPRYLDAAWAQYVTRKGTASDYIKRNVADAQRADLALVVGLNISKGGPNRSRMTPTMVRNFGSTLLSSSYPCAFLSWEYGSYLTTNSMKDALRTLRSKAQSRSSKSCRG
ncbi:MAG TPA: hypothetical protein VJ808_04305 [Gemmatimonadales bacterium]|nr:hypothetical protein [Gemmatimonadales bacterium]